MREYKENPFVAPTRPDALGFRYALVRGLLQRMAEWTKRLCKEALLGEAGDLSFSLGVRNAAGVVMFTDDASGPPFPDPDFRADMVVPTHLLLDKPEDLIQGLLEQLRFGFDLTQISP
jgi:hypothetical protein